MGCWFELNKLDLMSWLPQEPEQVPSSASVTWDANHAVPFAWRVSFKGDLKVVLMLSKLLSMITLVVSETDKLEPVLSQEVPAPLHRRSGSHPWGPGVLVVSSAIFFLPVRDLQG